MISTMLSLRRRVCLKKIYHGLAVAKVQTETTYIQSWFFSNMRSAWGLAQDAKFCAIENNLYVIQFFCLGDWEKVMEGGPWNFRNFPVLIELYDGFLNRVW
jgi:hypothetical protein